MKRSYLPALPLLTATLMLLPMISATAKAEEELSLQAALGEGIANSPSLKKYEALHQEAKWRKVAAYSKVLPQVDFFANHNFDVKYQEVPVSLGGNNIVFPLPYPKSSYGVEASWTLFDGFANWQSLGAAHLNEDAAESEYSRKDFETRKKIEISYYAAIAAVELANVAERNLKTVKESLSRAQLRLKNGMSTSADLLRIEVQASEAQNELERAQDNIAIRRLQLAEAMGLNHDERKLQGTLPLPQLVTEVSGLEFKGVQDREDIIALQQKAEASHKEVRASYGALVPSVALVANYSRYDIDNYSLPENNATHDAYNIGIAARWSILDGGATIAKPGIQNAIDERVHSELSEALLKAPVDFQLWQRRYIYSAHFYKSRAEDIKRSEESLRIVSAGFQQGTRIINEVLDAETDLFRARAGAVQAQLEAQEALTQLELAIGRNIE